MLVARGMRAPFRPCSRSFGRLLLRLGDHDRPPLDVGEVIVVPVHCGGCGDIANREPQPQSQIGVLRSVVTEGDVEVARKRDHGGRRRDIAGVEELRWVVPVLLESPKAEHEVPGLDGCSQGEVGLRGRLNEATEDGEAWALAVGSQVGAGRVGRSGGSGRRRGGGVSMLLGLLRALLGLPGQRELPARLRNGGRPLPPCPPPAFPPPSLSRWDWLDLAKYF